MKLLGRCIRERRLSKELTMRELADKTGTSHTEIFRIETGKREYPSMRILTALARALDIPELDVLQLAGYKPEDDGDMSIMEKVFPDLKTEKLQDPTQRIIDGVFLGADLQNSDCDELVEHMEKWLDYTRRK